MEVNIADLTWSTFIYPREGKSEKTVKAYIEALTIGAKFPPIKIQRVLNYPHENEKIEATLILDGIHRWLAFKECGYKKIEAVEWKKQPLNYEINQIALLLEAARCNLRHGDRLSPKDKKQIARDIATSDPECRWTEKALAERLGVIQQTVNTWISDIRARQRAGREIIIIRLNRLGWGLRTWDQWNFNECLPREIHVNDKQSVFHWGDERFGDDWPGRIPAQLVAHTLFYFTNPGDLIFGPMAGGCVVSDVCLVFERKCQSFDLATRDNRPEIQYHHWDPQNGHWPSTKKPDLIFFDPPYYTKMEKEYKGKAKEKAPSISSYSKGEYEEFFKSFFHLAHQNVKETSRIAFLNADWRDFQSTPALKENPLNSITIFDYHRILSAAGWEVTHRIECPLSTERMSGNEVQKMQEKRILGTVGRSLIIGRRVGNGDALKKLS